MPELPEVEVTRQSFADHIATAHVLAVNLGKPLRWPLGVEPKTLVGQAVLGVRRRGKYLLLDLSGGLLLLHLGMSGSLQFAQTLPPAGKHDHFDLVTTLGTLRLNDPRRFGAAVWATGPDAPVAQKLLGGLGVEPLTDDFDALSFWQALRRRKTSIKQVLLAGDVVVGVGNIYASEALFLARINPSVQARLLSKPRVLALHSAIRQVLGQALEQGGSTLRNFSNALGESGHFQLAAMVYDRAGQPCRVCQATIAMLRQGQRSTFYCPVCQKR